MNERVTGNVLGASIDVGDWDSTVRRISGWAAERQSRYVCIVNAHSVVTARHDAAFEAAIAGADMSTPDGAPVAWMLRRLGHDRQEAINGPDLMLRYCAHAAATGQSIFLLGGAPATLEKLKAALLKMQPRLVIAGAISPPFRPVTPEEDAEIVAAINRSGAGTVWVGLGCPKQELWMAAHRGRVQAVMLGVGAAFDFHSGVIIRAPLWMRRSGLEWLHRLASEPRRLWKRYLVTNTLFVAGAFNQLAMRMFVRGSKG